MESAKEIKHDDTEQNESQSEHGNETIEQTNTDTVKDYNVVPTEPTVPTPVSPLLVPSSQQQIDTNKS